MLCALYITSSELIWISDTSTLAAAWFRASVSRAKANHRISAAMLELNLTPETPQGPATQPNMAAFGPVSRSGVRLLTSLPQFTGSEVQEAFNAFDLDGNSFIGAAELRQVYTALGDDVTDEEVEQHARALRREPQLSSD